MSIKLDFVLKIWPVLEYSVLNRIKVPLRLLK